MLFWGTDSTGECSSVSQGVERAGPYKVPLSASSAEADRVEALVRDFVWKHWSNERAGEVTITYFSKEGEPSAFTYRVEADGSGRWQISVNITRRLVNRLKLTPFIEKRNLTFYEVRRIEIPKKGSPTRDIPASAQRSATEFRLLLKGEGQPPEMIL